MKPLQILYKQLNGEVKLQMLVNLEEVKSNKLYH